MDASPWNIVLLVIYCHGWELEATVDKIKKISSRLGVKDINILVKDLEVQGLIVVNNNKITLTKKGLSHARRVCEKHEELCDKVEREVWSEAVKRSTTLKRFMRG
jgi:Mn-dependent DtxR family transcriptional regulator